MSELRRYRAFIADSARWEGFPLRADDIVVTTPSKSGTTWMQTILALLLFDGVPDAAVYDISPWLDMHTRSRAEVESLLAAQTHRRFIKTHTPLDGLPTRDGVTTITVARDPRDVFVSMLAHGRNMDRDAVRDVRTASVGDDDLAELPQHWPDTDDPRALVATFLDLDRYENHADVNLANVLHHLGLAWRRRHDPDVVLVHYADLLADLTGEMRRIRDALGIEDRPDDRVEELAVLAGFDSMRSRAGASAPEASTGVWRDPAAFFRGGRRGDGAAMMTADELARYERRCERLTTDLPDADDFLAWVHHGRSAIPADT